MSNQDKWSRRQFVGLSGALLGGIWAAPYFVPASVLSAPGRVGANDRIGVGYIGCGRRSAQLRNLPQSARIVAASDLDLPRAQAVAERYGGQAFVDYRQLLESGDVDAVVIATPDHWHALPSIHACQAGKDVYCEKPLTLTIAEGRLMVSAARKHDRVFQTGSQQRSTVANREACRLVREGHLGKVLEVIGHNYPSPWLCKFPAQDPPAGLDWDAWCGQAPLRPFHNDIFTPRANPGWISFRDYSGGEMTGWGAHGLDQVQWALGMDETGPVEIWTEGEAFQPPVYTAPESRKRGDAAGSHPQVSFRYANGVTLKLADGPPGGCVVVGERGKITIDRGKFKIEPAELSRELLSNPKLASDGSEQHMQNWIDCIQSRQKPAADVEIGHRSATLCHLGNIARELGRKLRWDPAKETFPDDNEASALVARDQRQPYQFPQQL